MDQTFTIKVGEFEGPLDLLLQLIERKKLHISEISLAKVADDYLGHISSRENIPKKDLADFLVVGSTLMFIKSLSLLPTLARTEEESASIEDLQKRLAMYQRFKQLSSHIKDNFGKNNSFFRQESKLDQIIFAPSQDASIENLVGAVKRVIASLPKPNKIPQAVVKKVISLETVIENLSKRIQSSLKLKFNDFVGDNRAEKVNVIVSFLGMLELVRQGILSVRQDDLFQDIDMETSDISTPRYDA